MNVNKDQTKHPSKAINIVEIHSSLLLNKCKLNLLNNELNFGISDYRKVLEDVIALVESVI